MSCPQKAIPWRINVSTSHYRKKIDVPFVEKTHGYFILCTSIPIKVQSLWWSTIHDWTNPAYMSSMTRCNGKFSHWSFGMIRPSLASLTSTLSPSPSNYSYHHRLLGLWTLRSLQMIMVRPFALCAGTSFETSHRNQWQTMSLIDFELGKKYCRGHIVPHLGRFQLFPPLWNGCISCIPIRAPLVSLDACRSHVYM